MKTVMIFWKNHDFHYSFKVSKLIKLSDFLIFFPITGIQWAHLLQNNGTFLSCFETMCLTMNSKSRFWPFLRSNISELPKCSETSLYSFKRMDFHLSETVKGLVWSNLAFEQSPFPWTLFWNFSHTNFNWLEVKCFSKQARFEVVFGQNYL